MLSPVKQSKLSDQVFGQLRDSILGEKWRPGERLPTERELCETLRVNRSSVREALKRLEQARLIDIRHGNGSIVLDFRTNAGFDLLRNLVVPDGRIDRIAIRSIFEFRSLIGPEIARLAARRIREPELAELAGIVERIDSAQAQDAKALLRLDYEFHHTLVRASENLALMLIVNSIKDVYSEFQDFFIVMFERSPAERGIYRRLYAAVRARDEKQSQRLCRELIEGGNRIFFEHYRLVDSDGSGDDS